MSYADMTPDSLYERGRDLAAKRGYDAADYRAAVDILTEGHSRIALCIEQTKSATPEGRYAAMTAEERRAELRRRLLQRIRDKE